MPQATHDVQQLNQAIQAAMRSVRGGGAQFGGGGAQFGGGQYGGGFTRMSGDSGWEQQLADPLRERIRDAIQQQLTDNVHEQLAETVKKRVRETLRRRLADDVRSCTPEDVVRPQACMDPQQLRRRALRRAAFGTSTAACASSQCTPQRLGRRQPFY
jgi:hypothetical protein